MPADQKPKQRKPDYIGSWGVTPLQELTRHPYPHGRLPDSKAHTFFHLFIDKTFPEEGERLFEGRSLDTYGWANCKGTVSKDYIDFTKRYSRKAIAQGANPGELRYKGARYVNGPNLAEVCAGIITGKRLSTPKIFVMIARSDLR